MAGRTMLAVRHYASVSDDAQIGSKGEHAMRYIVTAAESGGKFYDATKETAESQDARGAVRQALQRARHPTSFRPTRSQ